MEAPGKEEAARGGREVLGEALRPRLFGPSSFLGSQGEWGGGPTRTAIGLERVPRAISRRPPRSAAVALSCEEGGTTYADALRRARELISLEDLKIESTRIRRAATEAMLIELPDDGSKENADLLAGRLKDVLSGVRVTRPTYPHGGSSHHWFG